MKRILVTSATTLALVALPTPAFAMKPVKSIQFSTAAFFANETDVSGVITLTRTWSSGTATVRLSTVSGGTASAGTDYTALTNVLVTFARGATSANAQVPLLADGVYDEATPETVNLALSSPAKGSTLGSPSTATLTITDTDPPAAPVVTATTGTNDGEVGLSWPAVPGATDYQIARSGLSGGPYAGPFSTGGAISVTDSGLTPGTTYYYVVYASSTHGTSPASVEKSAVSGGTLPADLVVNGGFETGDFTGWTIGANNFDPFSCGPNNDEACLPAPDDPAISDAIAHGGTYSAFLGDTGTYPSPEPAADIFVQQTFTVPVGENTTLSLWHWDASSDTVAYDQIRVFLVDTVTETVLLEPLRVADNAGWNQTTADLTPYAGHMVRLVLLVREDGHRDPTSVYFDDVSVTHTT